MVRKETPTKSHSKSGMNANFGIPSPEVGARHGAYARLVHGSLTGNPEPKKSPLHARRLNMVKNVSELKAKAVNSIIQLLEGGDLPPWKRGWGSGTIEFSHQCNYKQTV